MRKYNIYIGWNNETKQLEKEKAIDIISKYFEGFTAYEVIGFWKGGEEHTLKVEIVADDKMSDPQAVRVCKELQKELKQEAVMLEKLDSNVAFIQ